MERSHGTYLGKTTIFGSGHPGTYFHNGLCRWKRSFSSVELKLTPEGFVLLEEINLGIMMQRGQDVV